jgi:peptidoglycan/xylan/chitin deacetylase (PgdA/CDA1 family)
VALIARAAAGVAAALPGLHLVPSVLTVPAVHRRLSPGLSGRSGQPHVALTFDDGPDPESTPAFLDALAGAGVHATFFLLGTQLERAPELGRRLVEQGHEVAVHGWRHVPHLLRTPWAIGADVTRTAALIESACGVRPSFWRPPNGIISGAGLWAARQAGLRPVLWTADGQDWARSATPESIGARIRGRLEAGGVVLLHDSDITSAEGSWRAAVAAVAPLIEYCREQDWKVGPLREHGL